jgi:hypothetical protein
VYCLEVSTSVITAQREFRARFKKMHYSCAVPLFITRALNSRCAVITAVDTSRQHTESLPLLRRHLGNCSSGHAVSMRSELLVAHEQLGQFPLLTVCVVSV